MDNKLREERILIARFMTDEPEVLEKDLLKAGCVESMQYDSDWNWIMPVVEKIEELGYCFRIESNDVFIMDNNTSEEIIIADDNKSKIDAIYWACVRFIGWYDRNKNKEL